MYTFFFINFFEILEPFFSIYYFFLFLFFYFYFPFTFSLPFSFFFIILFSLTDFSFVSSFFPILYI